MQMVYARAIEGGTPTPLPPAHPRTQPYLRQPPPPGLSAPPSETSVHSASSSPQSPPHPAPPPHSPLPLPATAPHAQAWEPSPAGGPPSPLPPRVCPGATADRRPQTHTAAHQSPPHRHQEHSGTAAPVPVHGRSKAT